MISAATPIGVMGKLFAWWSTKVDVSGTQIFARLDGARQAVVYSMQLSSRNDAVMVLPLPVDPAFTPGEDAVEFVDFSGYHEFFTDVERAFPPLFPAQTASRSAHLSIPDLPRPNLVVHKVGSYDASFVPTIGDFDRLDRRLRLPDTVWEKLPEYADYGFAVFKLRKGKRNRVHPMAFWFHTREPNRLFFPTVHVHDRKVHDRAAFDHALYFQLPGALESMQTVDANGADTPIRAVAARLAEIDLERARGVVTAEGTLCALSLHGKLPNRDYRVTSPGR